VPIASGERSTIPFLAFHTRLSRRQEIAMPCETHVLRKVPLFANLDEEELGILTAQVRLRKFGAQHRIYKIGAPAQHAYVLLAGSVRVTTVDEDQQEVVVNEPAPGEFFGFASMLDETAHQTEATATSDTECIEVDRNDILVLVQRRPRAAMDMLAVLGRQFHAAQQVIRSRSLRHPNEVIEEQATPGEHVADVVAGFGGSWSFILLFGIALTVYTAVNVSLARRAWDPYPFILLNLFLSMLAAIQAPVIMMSQNRQDKKDRLRGELDFDVNRRALFEIQGLAHKLNQMGDRVADIQEQLRGKE
jgi:CRP/FNR family cyclic AMP-dependent transcriptional regulator